MERALLAALVVHMNVSLHLRQHAQLASNSPAEVIMKVITTFLMSLFCCVSVSLGARVPFLDMPAELAMDVNKG